MGITPEKSPSFSMQKISQEGPDVIRIPELKGALFDVVYDVGIVGSFGFLRLVTTFIDGLFFFQSQRHPIYPVISAHIPQTKSLRINGFPTVSVSPQNS